MKVIVIGALPSSLLNFRKALILDLISKGHEVVTAASGATSAEVQAIEKLGVRYIDFHVERNGLNPVSDIKTYWRLRKIFKVEQPQVILAYTIKPVIWGGIAARAVPNSKFYALITGLGFAFQRGGFRRNLLRLLACKLYKFALLNAPKVIFQNRDNKGEFLSNNIITGEQSACINGSGVDLGRFSICEFPSNGFKVLTIARLLGEKGLREYAAAAKEIKKTFPNVVFQLVGPEDPSPDGIPIEEVNEWHQAGYIDYVGEVKDVYPVLKNCNVFVLASYHEGMPRTVLEAMAVGRPVLTTNVPGCKETVRQGVNGFLVDKQSVTQLVEKLTWFISNPSELVEMGGMSREIAVEKFDVSKVNKEILEIMEVS